jgi:hypothetical protein
MPRSITHHKQRMMLTPLEQRLTQENESLRQENKLLREKVDLLVRKIFGKSSEQLDSAQLLLMLQGEDDAKKPAASQDVLDGLEAELEKGDKELKSKPARRHDERKPRIPDHLPVSEEITVVPAEVEAQPEAWRRIGEEVTEPSGAR